MLEGRKQCGGQVEFIKQQREVEAGGRSGEWIGRRKKQVPGRAARVIGALLGYAQPGCRVLAVFAPPA